MSSENGTETTRSDALGAAESLFGDTPADQTVEGEASPTEDLKVVVSIKGSRATIGVQQPSSDPHIESFDDPDLSGLVREVLAVVERARARWEDSPKHPAYERPTPSSRASATARTSHRRRTLLLRERQPSNSLKR